MDVGNVDDNDEQSHEGEVDPQPLEEYLSGPCDVLVFTQYHLHVAYHVSEGIVRFYNFHLSVFYFY
jgi:hypothetical protein